MSALPVPPKSAIIYEDESLYCCLASYPLTIGHTVVVWKDSVPDLHLLNKEQYRHLMWVVDRTRNALLKTLEIEKVYLMYLDEANHVHWHLIPRYNEQGYNLLKHHPKLNKDYSLVNNIKENFLV